MNKYVDYLKSRVPYILLPSEHRPVPGDGQAQWNLVEWAYILVGIIGLPLSFTHVKKLSSLGLCLSLAPSLIIRSQRGIPLHLYFSPPQSNFD